MMGSDELFVDSITKGRTVLCSAAPLSSGSIICCVPKPQYGSPSLHVDTHKVTAGMKRHITSGH